MSPPMAGELPLRVIETGGGLTIRALCGAEAVVVKPAAEVAAAFIRAAHRTGVVARGLSGDVSPAAVIRMAAHVKGCDRCQDLMAAQEERAETGV